MERQDVGPSGDELQLDAGRSGAAIRIWRPRGTGTGPVTATSGEERLSMRGSCRPIDVALALTSSTSRSMSSDYSKPVQVRSARGRSADEHSVGRAVDPREHVEDMQDEVVTPTCTTSTAKARAHDRASEESIMRPPRAWLSPGQARHDRAARP